MSISCCQYFKEIEFAAPFVPPDVLHMLIWNIARMVQNGLVILPGAILDKVIEPPFQVKAVESWRGIRLILPDASGRLDLPMSEPYATQYLWLDEPKPDSGEER